MDVLGVENEVIWEFKAKDDVYSISIKDDVVVLVCERGYTYVFDFNVIKIKQPLTNSLTNLIIT